MRALVTGGATGIGRATAIRLAADGFDLAVHARGHRREAEDLVAQLRANGRESFATFGDLATADGVRLVAEEVSRGWDRLDALVLNAGEYVRGAFEQLDWAAWERCLTTNVIGEAELLRQLLPRLRAAPAPRVVFVASRLAFAGGDHGAAYAAAKAALVGLSGSLALELAPAIHVNAVAPGAIDTAILAHDTPEERAARAAKIPLGRVGRPEEVADAIAFLVSPRAAFLTGTTIHVNGGARIG